MTKTVPNCWLQSNLGNAKTDGMDKDLGFVGEQYSLLILLFYIPNGLCDLPLNMLTKRWSGKLVLPSCMGSCFALLVCAKLLIQARRSDG